MNIALPVHDQENNMNALRFQAYVSTHHATALLPGGSR